LIKLGLAQAKSEDEPLSGPARAGLGAGTILAGAGGVLGAGAAMETATNHVGLLDQHLADTGAQRPITDISQDLIDQYKKQHGHIDVGWVPEDGPHYNTENHTINARMDQPALLAHELGHAELGAKHPVSSRFIYKLQDKIRGVSPYVAMSAGLMHADEDHAGTVAGLTALTHLPELADEGYATYRALQKLKNVGYSRGRALRSLAPAFGTYLADTVADMGGNVFNYETGRGARYLADKFDEPAPSKPNVTKPVH
jgi:hypothetical protein